MARPATGTLGADVPSQYAGEVKWAAQQLRIPASVVAAQINLESGFDPTAVSPTGAQGIAQFEPGTWSSLGCGGSPDDPQAAFRCYVTFMHQLLTSYHGNIRNALAAYNAGPGDLSAGYGYADSILSAAKEPFTVDAGAGGPSAADTATVEPFSPETCLWAFPGIQIPIVGNAGQFCLLSKSQARAWIGAALLAAGGLVLLPGLALVVAGAGVKALGAAGPTLEKTGAAVALIPGAQGAGVAIAGAGRAGRSSAEATQRRRARRDAEAERRLGEPRENEELEVGRGAVRETPAETRRRRAGASRARARRAANPGPAASRTEAGF